MRGQKVTEFSWMTFKSFSCDLQKYSHNNINVKERKSEKKISEMCLLFDGQAG